MNGRVAKRLRKKVYGLHSYRIARRYQKLPNGVVVNVGLRAAYQREKQEYYRR